MPRYKFRLPTDKEPLSTQIKVILICEAVGTDNKPCWFASRTLICVVVGTDNEQVSHASPTVLAHLWHRTRPHRGSWCGDSVGRHNRFARDRVIWKRQATTNDWQRQSSGSQRCLSNCCSLLWHLHEGNDMVRWFACAAEIMVRWFALPNFSVLCL